jgi:hypothetical protein
MRGAVIGKIVGSKSAKYPVGSYVYAPSGWSELAVFDDSNKEIMKVELPKDGKLTDTLGVLGKLDCFPRFFQPPVIGIVGKDLVTTLVGDWERKI